MRTVGSGAEGWFGGIRMMVHPAFVSYLVLAAADVRNPEPILFSVLAAGVFAASRGCVRTKFRTALRDLRALRVIDMVLWNGFLMLLLSELFLAAADRMTRHPLLLPPNAKSQERIQRYRSSLPDPAQGDPRNSLGFNDPEWLIPKPQGTFRVVALGDGFAFGVVGYEKNFLTLLEAELNAELPVPIEVCNLGIPALDPIDYLEILNTEGTLLEPDLVLVCLFAGNDFVKASRGCQLRLRNTRTFSLAWRLFRLWLEAARMRKGESRPSPGEYPDPVPLSHESYLEVAERYVEFVLREPPPETDQKFRDTLAVLDRILERTRPGRLVIAVLPSEIQVNSLLRQEIAGRLGLSAEDWDLSRPAREVARHFRASGVPVIDLLPAFIEAEKAGFTYIQDESHWTAHGNQTAAAALKDVVVAQIRRLVTAPAVRSGPVVAPAAPSGSMSGCASPCPPVVQPFVRVGRYLPLSRLTPCRFVESGNGTTASDPSRWPVLLVQFLLSVIHKPWQNAIPTVLRDV